MRQAEAFCFLSKKGGVGKTTLTLNCAHALAFSGFRVLLVDMDGQANLTQHLLAEAFPNEAEKPDFPDVAKLLLKRRPAEECVIATGYENLDLLAGSSTLDDLPLLDPRLIREPARLQSLLAPLAGDYEYIFVDCPPLLNWLTRMVLFAAGSVIMPIQAEPYALQGLRDLVGALDRMTATAQLYKIVVNMYRANTQLHRSALDEIRAAFPGRVAEQTVRQTIQLAEAARAGLSVFEYAPASLGAQDLYALCWELFRLSPEKIRQNARARGGSETPESHRVPHGGPANVLLEASANPPQDIP